MCVAKTKALICFAVTAKLVCAFVFAYANCLFSHAAAQISREEMGIYFKYAYGVFSFIQVLFFSVLIL